MMCGDLLVFQVSDIKTVYPGNLQYYHVPLEIIGGLLFETVTILVQCVK